MLLVRNIRLPLTCPDPDAEAAAKALAILRVPARRAAHCGVAKLSVDARHGTPVLVYTIAVTLKDEGEESALAGASPCVCYTQPPKFDFTTGKTPLAHRPVVVGLGPAGLFAALLLARRGYRPLVLERGPALDERIRAVEHFEKTGTLDPNANIQFGEGGAGTFSDGKLTTRVGDPLCAFVTGAFLDHGAPADIAWRQKPHVGTDLLRGVIRSIRGEIEALGGEAGVTQLAVTVDTSPDSGVRFRRNLAKRTVKDAPELAARAMAQIMDLYATGGASSSVILTLTFRYVDVRDGKFLEPEDAARRIGQLVPNLIRRIADAGGGTARTLTIDEISRMVRVSYDPATQDTLEQADGQPWIEWEDAGPVACEAGWDHYRHDSGVSRTWEMCDPPKSNVTSSTLARLLGPLSDCDRKRVTVVFHVLPPDKTAFMAEQNRQRAAKQVSQEKRASISAMSQINKANRQAIETNRGAAIVFFGMLVTATVRAGNDERMRLEQATHAVEGAAGSAKIDLRPCYGAQDTAFAASLPLGLNLRNYTPPSAFAALT